MIIHSPAELAQYKAVGALSTEILGQLRQAVAVGVTPLQIDTLAFELCAKHGAIPNFVGVGPKNNRYQHAMCISVNDTILHGIPDATPLQKGDIVKLDFGLQYQGLNSDHCCTVVVGEFVSQQDEKLVKTTRQAVQAAAKLAVAGKRVGDLGFAMASTAWEAGFDVVKEFVGHGIGKTLHEEPQIPAYGKKGAGEVLREGMVICVEAQVVAGSDEIYQLADGWTIKTVDGARSAMFEYMVMVGKHKPVYLTPTLDWPIVTGE